MNIQMPYISIEPGSLELGLVLFHLTHPQNESDTLATYFLEDIKKWSESRNLIIDEDFLLSPYLCKKNGKVYLNDDLIKTIQGAPISGAWPIFQKIREEFFIKTQQKSGLDKYF